MTTKNKKAGGKAARKEVKNLAPKEQFDWLHQVAFWGLALLLFFPPYFRGLFFAPEQEKALMFAALVFWLTFLWRWLQNDHKFLRGPLDWFALALPVVYILSTFTAVNKGLAIDEVVKNVLYFLTYWSASRLIRDEEDIHKLLHVIYISAIGVALAGLATATELIHIKDGFLGGRIYSSFQYPNALASYLGAVLFIGMYLWYRAKDFTNGTRLAGQSTNSASLPGGLSLSNPWGYLYACGNFLLLAVLLGTKSRGGLLVFGLVFLIYLAGLGARGRLAATLHTALNAVVAYICIEKFISLAMDKHYNQAWVWILSGLAAALVIQLVYRLADRHILTPWSGNAVKFNLIFGGLAGLGAIIGVVLLRGRADLWEKVTNFWFLRNAFERMYFVGDAIEMFKEKPLLGWGGGGWEEAYRSFQDYLYNSNEVHSFYFQVGVETGLLGLLAVAGIWLSFLLLIFKLYRRSKGEMERFQTAWVLLAAFLVTGGHALIDFDLSLSALTLVVWTVFGITGGMANPAGGAAEPAPRKKRAGTGLPNGIPVALASLATILVLVPALLLAQSHAYAQQAGQYLQARQIDKGQANLEKAAAYNPYNPDIRVTLSQIYRAKSDHEKSLAQALRAVELSPYNAQRRFNLADAYIASGQYQKAVEQAEKAVELAPFQQQWYEVLAERYFLAGYDILEKGDQQQAKEYLQKAAQLPDRMKSIAESLPELYNKMWTSGPRLAPTPPIFFSAGAAKYQLGDYSTAEQYLQEAVKINDNNIKGQALLWLALTADKQGQSGRSEQLLKQAGELIPDAGERYNHVKGLSVFK